MILKKSWGQGGPGAPLDPLDPLVASVQIYLQSFRAPSLNIKPRSYFCFRGNKLLVNTTQQSNEWILKFFSMAVLHGVTCCLICGQTPRCQKMNDCKKKRVFRTISWFCFLHQNSRSKPFCCFCQVTYGRKQTVQCSLPSCYKVWHSDRDTIPCHFLSSDCFPELISDQTWPGRRLPCRRHGAGGRWRRAGILTLRFPVSICCGSQHAQMGWKLQVELFFSMDEGPISFPIILQFSGKSAKMGRFVPANKQLRPLGLN